uniref:Lipase maturation factor 2 n=1 Tax=Anthurium amnicola TaxID=1678845 RepID=A0A1D1ZBR5_9ARAE
MAHALPPQPAAATPAAPPARERPHAPPPALVRVGRPGVHLAPQHQRRTFIYGLVGAGLGSAMHGGAANAASRRPPPPPPTEKKDPNVSGVQAKVLASIKRKEAMKEAMAKLREKGKPITELPPPE